MWIHIAAVVIALALFVEVAAILLRQRREPNSSRQPELVD